MQSTKPRWQGWVEPWYLAYALMGLVAAGLVPVLIPLSVIRAGNAGQVGLVMAAVSLGGLSSPVWGSLADRYRLHRWLLAGGMLITTAGLAAFAFTTQPVDLTVDKGTSATFSTTASGIPTPSYQWYFNGAAISGATGNTLNLTNVQSANAGNYTVVFTIAYGSVTSAIATLTVSVPAAITGVPIGTPKSTPLCMREKPSTGWNRMPKPLVIRAPSTGVFISMPLTLSPLASKYSGGSLGPT